MTDTLDEAYIDPVDLPKGFEERIRSVILEELQSDE